MILIRSRLFRYYHFVKPTLSSINSIQELQKIMQKRLVRSIKNSNQERIKQYNIEDALKKNLAIEAQLIQDIKQRTVKHTIINSATQQYMLVDALIDQKIESLNIQGFDISHPFSTSNDALHHFTQKRGAPNFQQLKEYDFQSPALYLFNLPISITSKDIKGSLPIPPTTNVTISFKYCLLGLPAYAKVEFQTQQKLNEVMNKLTSKEITFGDRISVIKTSQDAQKMRLGWRRMVVNLEEDSKFDRYLVNFSKYGRVLHLEWPIQVSKNPTLEQVKQFYANSTELIKLNIIQKDGTVQSEYYPPLSVWSVNQDNRGEENYLERAQKLKESYENRTRFAKNVNVKVGKQNKIQFNNKGYCVVTYSTYQECQNFYFSHGSDSKMQLVEGRLDFQFDPLFKKELLRQIDNDFLIGKKKSYEQKQALKKTYLDPVNEGLEVFQKTLRSPNAYGGQFLQEDNFKIAQRIFNKMCIQQLLETSEIKSWYLQNYKNGNDPITQWTMYLQKFKETKKQMNKKSFDELAEQELFGRVLPKDDNIERFIVDNDKYKEMREIQLTRDNLLLTTFRQLQIRQKFYKRAFERNNRLAVEAEGMNIQIQPTPQGEQQLAAEEATPASDGTSIGKQSFSTYRPAPLYRKRTVEEEAHFQIRYNQFLRSTIYEYMGVFQDKLIEQAAQFRSQLINPHSLKWQNGQSYLTQDDLLKVLQFRRDFSNAQVQYQDFVYGSQYSKSKGLSIDSINSNYKSYQQKALRYISDVGIVEDIKKVNSSNLQEKVDILNAEIANFGEEYRIDEINGEQVLVKVRKYQPVLSLDRVDHLQKFVNEHGNDITSQQSAAFEKHYLQMKQSGVIPNEVCDAFGVQRGKTLKDLLSQIGSLYNIQKKDLQMAERAKTMSKEDINSDINNQINLQKTRTRLRKLNSDQFVKDPSQIYAKDQQGYYKVSRYRQI